jgi:xylulokinase
MSSKIHGCIGIDIGSSGIRVLLLNTQGNTIKKEIISFERLKRSEYHIWDEHRRIHLTPLLKTLNQLLLDLAYERTNVQVQSLSISSIGPSLVLLSENGEPISPAYTYAYKGAHSYIKNLDSNFQIRTGSMFSGALPYVQLLKLVEEDSLKNCLKITTLNDYITWWLTDLPVSAVFSTLPNASYTGLYSMENEDWDWQCLKKLDLQKTILPTIIPLGSIFPLRKELTKHPLFVNTQVVAGTIDGIDAFWATGSRKENVVVGSVSTTGALRRWRHTRKQKFNSRLIQSLKIDKNSWVELIPFNNVGTSFNWLAQNFKQKFSNYLTETHQIDIEKLEKESKSIFHLNNGELSSYLLTLPLFFPYIEGEPRGPQGRGNIQGGFIIGEKKSLNSIDLYIALILGISSMFRHNFDVLFSRKDFAEIRLTGQIARKSELFLTILATLTDLNVVIMKKEQSVAWATAMRSLTFINEINEVPKLETFDPVVPMKGEFRKVLETLYTHYLKVYEDPEMFEMVTSDIALMEI